MSNRPDPAQFAHYSYILAIVSAGIMGLSFVLALLSNLIQTDPLQSSVNDFASVILWLVLLTGSIGAFMGYAARVDFRGQSVPDKLANKARVGFRVNLAALIVTLLMAILALALAILSRLSRY
jgi:hypothetical protein